MIKIKFYINLYGKNINIKESNKNNNNLVVLNLISGYKQN